AADSTGETLPGDTPKLTQAGAVMGSPMYMSPEQWIDASTVGPPADVYALGALTYELLVGHPPFRAKTLSALAAVHARESVPTLGAGFPRDLDAVIKRALAKEPAERYASALAFGAALAAAVGLVEEAAPLPRLPDALRGEVLAAGPPPVAVALAEL